MRIQHNFFVFDLPKKIKSFAKIKSQLFYMYPIDKIEENGSK